MALSLLAAPAVISAAKTAWQGIRAGKAAVDNVQRLRRAPGELRFTAQLCASVLEPLAIAETLAIRQVSLNIIGAAVMCARTAIAECKTMLCSVADEDTDVGWADWLKTGTKIDELHRVQSRLVMAMNALQLALAAVAASLPVGCARSPFRLEPAAFELAHATMQQIELGRTRSVLLAIGDLWQRGIQSSGAGAKSDQLTDALRLLCACRVRLHVGSPPPSARRCQQEASLVEEVDDSDTDDDDSGSSGGQSDDDACPTRVVSEGTPTDHRLFLRFSCVAPGDEDATAEDRILELDETVQLRRLWSHELASELAGKNGVHFLDMLGHDEHVLCYELRPSRAELLSSDHSCPLVLAFQYGGLLSAESFEALLFLATSVCRGRKDASPSEARRPLSSVYDPDRPAAMLTTMQARVGPLLGAPEAASMDADAVLTTPMRGLGLGQKDTPSGVTALN
mmetsp:Transcript_31335/g.81858  ORF Transcript_31335/g.81858 Transcript_31335/m.81858 type:complete len:453 (+) Transcript_31335:67-1425(+)